MCTLLLVKVGNMMLPTVEITVTRNVAPDSGWFGGEHYLFFDQVQHVQDARKEWQSINRNSQAVNVGRLGPHWR